MVAIIRSIALHGMSAIPVSVEVTVSRGLPQFRIIGLPDKAVQEARDRVISALAENGYRLPLKKIIVNLAPADLKKDGGKFDLPIAIGILVASQLIPDTVQPVVVLGELSLDGELRRINAILAIVLSAMKIGHTKFIVPKSNSDDLSELGNVAFGTAADLSEAVAYFTAEQPLHYNVRSARLVPPIGGQPEMLLDIKGQPLARRAAMIAVAGRHNLLLYGPAGVGKTMLAKRLPYLMPPMKNREVLETTAIYSLFNWNEKQAEFIRERPFRCPHHSSSDISIIGGGSFPKPGEVSLAHNGILFLDEFQEFKRVVLNMLRQPLQDKKVVISRSAGSVTYPADFLLVCAMNSCPCGNFLDEQKSCICSPHQIKRYFSKIAGPLLDRIDLQIQMERGKNYSLETEADISVEIQVAEIKRQLELAEILQRERYQKSPYLYNSQLHSKDVGKYVVLDVQSRSLLKDFIDRYHPSIRAIDSILKITRTVADLEGSNVTSEVHLLEAMQYRTLESKIMDLDSIF